MSRSGHDLKATYAAHGGGVPHTAGFTPAKLGRWRKALARVRKGEADAKILCIGDSTVQGLSDLASAVGNAWPANLARLLDSTATPAAIGLATPYGAGSTDSRWTPGTGWPNSRNFGFALGAWQAVAPAGSLVYGDSRVTADRFDVYYMTNTVFGSIGVTATGGTTTNINTATAPGVSKVTVAAASAATTNTVTITATGNQVFIVGIEPWLSTTDKVRVGNAGVVSSSTATWVAGAPFGGLESIRAYAPDLAIVCLGINDAFDNVSTANYTSRLQQIIDAVDDTGDVILMTMAPSSGAPYTTYEPLYVDAMRDLDYPRIDVWDRAAGAYSTLNNLGMMHDDRHPSSLGLWDIAQLTADALRLP